MQSPHGELLLEDCGNLSTQPGALELLFLGTGNAFSMAGRYWGSILVNGHILLDASPIVVPHMKKLGRQLSKLEYIFLTHFHADHYFGLPFLLLDYAYLTPMEHPLNIIGPTGVKDVITRLMGLSFSGMIEKLNGRVELNYLEINNGGKYSVSGLDFSAVPMSHGDAIAFGYKFELGGKKVGYTGDTGPSEELINLGKDLDILIIEFSNPHTDVPGHMNIEKIQVLWDQLSPELKIILNHVGEIKGDLPFNTNLILPKDLEILHF